MKAIEKKEQYIILRGEGKSIRTACKELDISTSAGQDWEKELKGRIDAERADRLNELHETYGLMKEKRIITSECIISPSSASFGAATQGGCIAETLVNQRF